MFKKQFCALLFAAFKIAYAYLQMVFHYLVATIVFNCVVVIIYYFSIAVRNALSVT